jgi:ribosomal protein L9
VGCREIQAKIDAEEKEKAEIKAKAKAMATALQTLGVIRIPKKVCRQPSV